MTDVILDLTGVGMLVEVFNKFPLVSVILNIRVCGRSVCASLLGAGSDEFARDFSADSVLYSALTVRAPYGPRAVIV